MAPAAVPDGSARLGRWATVDGQGAARSASHPLTDPPLHGPVSVPGPPGGLWAISLLLWAVGAAVVGEAVRGALGRWVPLWRAPEPVERFLLDFYLGGAGLYLVAALELGAFVRPIVLGLPAAAGATIVYRVWVGRRSGAETSRKGPLADRFPDRWALLAVVSALGLYVVELVAALPVATGNTFDASLLTTYVALLLQHGNLPLSFRPYGTPAILYPQGTTVWLAWAQLDFGLPAARTSLLVTPLFLGLTPLAGFVLGRRLVGTSRAGAAFAVALAWLGPSTRALVGGSNDFVFALPLVLLLGAQSRIWMARAPPRWGDALGFGVLLGYSAAVNVVGAEWVLPALFGLGATASPRFGGRAVVWLGRWGATFASALVAGVPSLYVLFSARISPGSLAGALTTPPGASVGIGVAQLVGSVDPFLFRTGDVELSPIPIVRVELALLLVLGASALLWLESGRPERGPWSRFGHWALAGAFASVAWLVALVAAGVPGSPFHDLAYISSAAEFSLSLFTVYGLVAAAPLALAFDRLAPAGVPPPAGRPSGRRSERTGWFAPFAFAVIVVVPAVVLTPTSLGPVLSSTYADFGNVSRADFDLLAYAGAHFVPGARVLVAPGSAAEFLPGYARGVVLLYPMEPGWETANASYTVVVRELTGGTLDATGRRALASLAVDYVVVTGNNTVLWPAFWAAPLLEARVGLIPTFPVVWNEADAWVFNASGCRTGSVGCS